MERKVNIHSNHRERRLDALLTSGTEGMADHEVLEILLFYSIPQKDVNPLAHELIERFGGLSGVLEAEFEELTAIPGVGRRTAALLTLIRQVERRHMRQRVCFDSPVLTDEEAFRLLLPHFMYERDECVYLLCLDAKHKELSCPLVDRGSINAATVSIRRVVDAALRANATYCILAHNHTSGVALPSGEDVESTLRIADALSSVGVTLLDHLIIADDDYVSLRDNGVLPIEE